MSEESKLTNLKIILTPENVVFNFSGNVSVSEARSLLDIFRDLINVTNVINLPEIKENENVYPINDDELDYNDIPDLENEDGNIVENNNEQNVSIMRYPVRGQTMSLNGIRHHGETVMHGLRTFSSIMIKSSEPRVMYGNNLTHYRIVFPALSDNYPELTVNNGTIPRLFQGHSYPVCSCPSYYFRSYTISANNVGVNGLCKHIDEALASANIATDTINWTNRPDNMPYLLKTEGLNEYQWIPVPEQN
jgi:hypothetical protein